MQTFGAIAALQEAVARQISLGSIDPAVEAAATAILDIIEPTMRSIVLDLAQQAAVEIAAQLADYEIDVVLVDGEPGFRVRAVETTDDLEPGSYEARLTLRLPEQVKTLVERAAGDTGDSVNTWVVKALSSKARKAPGERRVKGTVEL